MPVQGNTKKRFHQAYQGGTDDGGGLTESYGGGHGPVQRKTVHAAHYRVSRIKEIGCIAARPLTIKLRHFPLLAVTGGVQLAGLKSRLQRITTIR